MSTLASALEKLQMPPPGRPNTTMGFNRNIGPNNNSEPKVDSKDDTSIGLPASKKSGLGPSSESSSQLASQGAGSRFVQRTLIGGNRTFGTGKSIVGTGSIMRGSGGFKVPGNTLKTGPRIFGVGGGAFSGAARVRTLHKASRKTSLPSVAASPVKGGDAGDNVMEIADDEDEGEVEVSANIDHDVFTNTPTAPEPTSSKKGKEKERSADNWRSNASRRASMASQALSQSLNALPPRDMDGLGSMGPPETPTGRTGTRSISSTYPLSVASTSSGGEIERVSPNTRSMTMGLRSAPGALEKTRGGVGGHVASSKRAAAAAAISSHESLKILNDCVIFVDVRTDDGDEAGSLFVEMLEGVGARV